jgi:hypothetical protein
MRLAGAQDWDSFLCGSRPLSSNESYLIVESSSTALCMLGLWSLFLEKNSSIVGWTSCRSSNQCSIAEKKTQSPCVTRKANFQAQQSRNTANAGKCEEVLLKYTTSSG